MLELSLLFILCCCASPSDAAMGCSDLLLHWVTLRFSETNTTVNLKCLEFVQALFHMLIQQTFRMSDYEAGAFLPYLILKVCLHVCMSVCVSICVCVCVCVAT